MNRRKPVAALVDHEPVQAGELSTWLDEEGFEVRRFESAAEALQELAKGLPPDILIANLHLPGIDGWRLSHLLRSLEFEEFNPVPLLLLSPTFRPGEGPGDPGSGEGLGSLVQVPVDRESFLAEVRRLLSWKEAPPGIRVLILEDEELLGGILKRFFQDRGDVAEAAATVAEARSRIEVGAFDVAILDYHLPDGTGDALLEELKGNQPGCISIMITADPSPELAVDWMRRGAAAYVRKPFKTDYMAEVLVRAQRERAHLNREVTLAERTMEAHETEEPLRRTAEHAPVIFYGFEMASDGTFSFPFVGNQVEAYAGFTAEEVQNDPSLLLDIIHPDDRELFRQSVLQSAADLSPYHIELRWLQNGEVRWMEAFSTPETVPGGGVRWHGFLNDVTARKDAEENLKEQAQLLRESQRVAGLGSYVFDVDRWIWTASETMDQIFGISGTEPERRVEFWLEIVHPDDREEMTLYLQDHVLGQGRPFDKEYRIQRMEDGATRWVHGRGELIKDEEGRVRKMLGTIEDITERRAAAGILRERTQFIESLAELSPDILYIYDLEKRENVYSNHRIETILGYSTSEVRELGPQVLSELLHPDDFQGYLEQVVPRYATAEDGEVVRHEFRMRHRDESWVWLEVQETVFQRSPDGSPQQILGVARDITERILVEKEKESLRAQFAQAQKMESVGRLAGGVAHDFNNMLGVILGRTEMTLDLIEPSSPLRENLLEIQRAAERSADLTGQLLAFARLQPAAPHLLNLNETAGGMLRIIQRLIGEDVDLVWAPGAELWSVRLDTSQVDQILANLCVNAKDSIEGVGKITIETGNAVFDQEFCDDHPGFLPGEFVRLAVSDNGKGIEKAVLEHIFEPFFTTKDVGHGTGLGLATVHGIVNQNDGFISVYSEPGRGTTFKLYFPRAQEGEERQPRAEATATTADHGETVLLVEDEGAILQMARAMLEGLGYGVLTAGNPSDALTVLHEGSPSIDLLITDVIMPEMNGRDLADRIRREVPELRVLYMSGYTADVIAHHGVLSEGVHFIQKPFSRRELSEKVREALA